MAVTTALQTGTKPYTVLRAMCMAGERVEIGETVELTITQGTELATAGKVTPFVPAPKRSKADKPKPADVDPAPAATGTPPQDPASAPSDPAATAPSEDPKP